MFVLQIAFGVVLAVMLLPILLALIAEFGGVIFLMLFAVVAMAVISLLFIDNPVFFGVIAILGLLIYFFINYENSQADLHEIKDLEKIISERKSLGYEAKSEEENLVKLKNKFIQKEQLKKYSSGSLWKFVYSKKYKNEQERRKSLGYDN